MKGMPFIFKHMDCGFSHESTDHVPWGTRNRREIQSIQSIRSIRQVGEESMQTTRRSTQRLANAFRRFVKGRGSVEGKTITIHVHEIRQRFSKVYPNVSAPVDTAAHELSDLIEYRPQTSEAPPTVAGGTRRAQARAVKGC